MADMNNMIVDIAGSSTARRGFADLFEASKTALDNIQWTGGSTSVRTWHACRQIRRPLHRNRHAPHGYTAFAHHARTSCG